MMYWSKQAGYVKNGLPDRSSKEIAEEIKSQFKWDEDLKRWV